MTATPIMINTERLKRDVIVIGASAGGVEALIQLFAALPRDLPASVAAVIHRSPLYNLMLGEVLGRRASLPVRDAVEGQAFEPGAVYLAPRDHHLRLENRHLVLDRGPKEHHTRPAVDPLFRSAAEAYGKRVVGVVLTGGGDDGVSGLIAIKAAHGIAIVQDPEEAKIAMMPRHAIRDDHVDLILTINGIAEALTALAKGHPVGGERRKRAEAVVRTGDHIDAPK